MKTFNEEILIADSDTSLCQTLKESLLGLGYSVRLVHNGKKALTTFKKEPISLLIIDVMLPEIDGYEVCREIRKESLLPIIMLSALDNIRDRIIGLEIGADDYLIKPFFQKELEARIKSILRRSKLSYTSSFLTIGPIEIDTHNKKVFKNNNIVRLTKIEFSILELLITKAGEQVSRNSILFSIWGYRSERHVDTRVVDVHISRLRAKLEEDSNTPSFILTKRGVGYMFQTFQNTFK